MSYRSNFTEQEVDLRFNQLATALVGSPVRSESQCRACEAGDFMLMSEKDGWFGFKHRLTRNYVFLREDGTLYVPRKDEYFMRGEFLVALAFLVGSELRADWADPGEIGGGPIRTLDLIVYVAAVFLFCRAIVAIGQWLERKFFPQYYTDAKPSPLWGRSRGFWLPPSLEIERTIEREKIDRWLRGDYDSK